MTASVMKSAGRVPVSPACSPGSLTRVASLAETSTEYPPEIRVLVVCTDRRLAEVAHWPDSQAPTSGPERRYRD